MAISAVSGVNLSSSNRTNVAFKGLEDEAPRDNQPRRASRVVTIPVAVLMTLSPSLLTAQGAETEAQMSEPEPTVLAMVAPQSNTQVADRIARVRGGVNVPADVRKEVVQHKERFTVNGKGYTMYWVDAAKSSHTKNAPNHISDIYFVPDGYKPIVIGEEHDKNQPPCLKGLIMHDYGSDEDCFCGAIVRDIVYDKNTNRASSYEYEIKLDNDAANHILDLLNGDTKFDFPSTTVRNNMSTVTTPTLQGKKQVW